MKVYAISDLHLSGNNPKPMDIFGSTWANYMNEIESDWRQRVTDDDLVLLAGDLSWAMNLSDAAADINRVCSLPGKKIITRGNHDYWWKSISSLRQALTNNTYAVQNDCVKIGNVIVCGSRGWATPDGGVMSAEDKKIYEREIIRMNLALDDMSKKREEGDLVAVMIHYPPFNAKFEPSPFTKLFEQYNVNSVVYGHLHGNGGRICLKREINGITYHLTSCDLIKNRLAEIF